MWVIFEGLDKSGKTTLEWEFLKATNFKHIVVDRGPAGYFVFDALFKRVMKNNKECYTKNLSVVNHNFMVVYCKAPIDIAMKRLEEHNEKCPYDYGLAQLIYDDAIECLYKQRGVQVVTINTEKPIDECVNEIIKKLEEVLK